MQWHFTFADGQWQPFSEEECATLTSALASGKRVVNLAPTSQTRRTVDLVHMIMETISGPAMVVFAAVSNDVSPAPKPTAPPAAEPPAVQPPPKRVNRSESVLRLFCLSFFFLLYLFTMMFVQSLTLFLQRHPLQHLQQHPQQKATVTAMMKCAMTKRSLSRRAKVSLTRLHSKRTAGFVHHSLTCHSKR